MTCSKTSLPTIKINRKKLIATVRITMKRNLFAPRKQAKKKIYSANYSETKPTSPNPKTTMKRKISPKNGQKKVSLIGQAF